MGSTNTSRRGASVVVIMFVAVLIVLLAGIAFLVIDKKRRALPTAKVETVQQRSEATIQAFASDSAAAPSDVDPAPLKATLDLLSAMMHGKRPHDVPAVFDSERSVREVERTPGLSLTRQERTETAAALGGAITSLLTGKTALTPWDECVVKRVQKLETPDDAIVYAKLRFDGYGIRYRFWMHKTDTWRIYDYEELDTSGRITSIFANMVPMLRTGNMASVQAFTTNARGITDAIRLMGTGDNGLAKVRLDAVSPGSLPPRLQFMYHLAKAMLACNTLDYPTALEQSKLAAALEPDSPAIPMIETMAYYGIGDYASTIASADRHIGMIGPSDTTCGLKAMALMTLGRTDEALVACEQGLADEPGNPDLIVTLVDLLPPDQQATVGERFMAGKPTMTHFQGVADACVERRAVDALDSIAVAYEARAGTSPDVAYYRATATLLRGDAKAAAAQFAPLLKTAPSRYEAALLESYLGAMAQSGQAQQAYRDAVDREGAIAVLLANMPPGAPDRESLAAEHLRAFPNSTAALLAIAQQRAADKQWDLAERAFARLVEVAPVEAKQKYRFEWAWHRMAAGRPADAYREIVPTKEGFDFLANAALDEDQLEHLQPLIDAHAQRFATDDVLQAWRGMLAYERQAYAEAVKAWSIRLADPDRVPFAIDPLTIRALVRQNRLAEATAHFARIPTEQQFARGALGAIIHAASHRPTDAQAALAPLLDGLADPTFTLMMLYGDEDLAPHLMSDDFAAWRAAHPRPKAMDEPADGDETRRVARTAS